MLELTVSFFLGLIVGFVLALKEAKKAVNDWKEKQDNEGRFM